MDMPITNVLGPLRKLRRAALILGGLFICLHLMTSNQNNTALFIAGLGRIARIDMKTVKEVSDMTLPINDSVAHALSKTVRVLCWVPAREADMHWRVRAVNQTWMKRCDGHVYFIQTDNPSAWPDVVSMGQHVEGYHKLAKKVDAAFWYIYKNYLDDFDWFFKADDNSYVIVENLRLLLSKYDPYKPVYLGHLYDYWPKGGHGFMAGGAGYAISRAALRLMAEEGINKGFCPVVESYSEDKHVAQCLHNVGVGRYFSRDVFERESFHQFNLTHYLVNPGLAREEIESCLKFPQSLGRDCCSEVTISFHYVEPDMMLVMDHILYRTSVYGRQPNLRVLREIFVPKYVPMP